MIRKKTIRLLLYDYQRTAGCYTIYGTFKQWSSDDFTTICREKLRLLLTSISYRAKARKRDAAKAANGSAPLAVPPAAGLPRRAGMVCDMLHRLAWIHDRGAPLHPFIYLIIIGGCADLYSVPAWRWYLVSVERVRARVCPPAWRRWYYSRLCRSGIVGG